MTEAEQMIENSRALSIDIATTIIKHRKEGNKQLNQGETFLALMLCLKTYLDSHMEQDTRTLPIIVLYESINESIKDVIRAVKELDEPKGE